MPFDYNSAISDGATDQQIAEFLSEKHNWDLNSALQDGATYQQAAQWLAQ